MVQKLDTFCFQTAHLIPLRNWTGDPVGQTEALSRAVLRCINHDQGRCGFLQIAADPQTYVN